MSRLYSSRKYRLFTSVVDISITNKVIPSRRSRRKLKELIYYFDTFMIHTHIHICLIDALSAANHLQMHDEKTEMIIFVELINCVYKL